MTGLVELATFTGLCESELLELAKRLGPCLRRGDVVVLSGQLGSGKTTFVRGLLEGLGGDPSTVSSPTFTLVNVYQTSEVTVYHADAFRLKNLEEAFFVLGSELEEGDGIFVVEWGESIAELLGGEYLVIRFDHNGAERRNVVVAASGRVVDRLRRCRLDGSKEDADLGTGA